MQGIYTNYSWTNISNDQTYGNGTFITSVSNLDAGIYVVMGSSPYGGCNTTTMTDTFRLLEPNLLICTFSLLLYNSEFKNSSK